MEKRWRDGHNWRKASAILRQAGDDTCRMAIVRIHSALDDFVVNVEAERTRWRDLNAATSRVKRNQKSVKAEDGDGSGDNKLTKMCHRTGLSAAEVKRCEPVLAYFRAIRNCIAHKSARASRELQAASTSGLLTKLMKTWPKRKGAKPPPIAPYECGQPILVQPKAVILYLDATRRCCGDIDKSLLEYLGCAGLSYCAAHHLLLDESLETLPTSYRRPNRGINHVLTTRYNVNAPGNQPMEELQRLGLWEKCRRRHAKLYKQSIDAGLFKLPHGFRCPT